MRFTEARDGMDRRRIDPRIARGPTVAAAERTLDVAAAGGTWPIRRNRVLA
jgi:hypothetical protein